MEAAKLYGPAAVNFLLTTGGIFWLKSSHSALAARVADLEKEKETTSKTIEEMGKTLTSIVGFLRGNAQPAPDATSPDPPPKAKATPKATPKSTPKATPKAEPEPSDEDLDEELDKVLGEEEPPKTQKRTTKKKK
jgi:hypothetical protein